MVVEEMGIDLEKCRFEFGETQRGWKGDVPIVRLDTARIRALGWEARYSSKEALRLSIREMLKNEDGLNCGF